MHVRRPTQTGQLTKNPLLILTGKGVGAEPTPARSDAAGQRNPNFFDHQALKHLPRSHTPAHSFDIAGWVFRRGGNERGKYREVCIGRGSVSRGSPTSRLVASGPSGSFRGLRCPRCSAASIQRPSDIGYDCLGRPRRVARWLSNKMAGARAQFTPFTRHGPDFRG